MSIITVEHVARIEGHGTIHVELEGSTVKDVHMEIVEPARFFEPMVVGRKFDEVSLVTSRICGICSPNHAVTSLKAIEDALGIQVSERTKLLRKLLVYGSYLQNHATHLYIFSAPDFLGLPSVFPLAETHPDVLERALKIKKAGNELCTLVGGRPVHPVTAVVGGFTHEPGADELEAFRDRLLALVDDAVVTAQLFDSFDVPEFSSSCEMLALADDEEYAVYDGNTAALEAGWNRPVQEYRAFIDEQVVGHSNAKHSTSDGRSFMTGAIARVNLSSKQLMPRAAQALASLSTGAVGKNTFLNNVCQAIELIDACERCAVYCDRLITEGGTSAPVEYEVKAGFGVGATEAPRGTVYHSYTLDDDGFVVSGDVITPTAQNLGNLDADMRAFAPTVAGLPHDEFILQVEELVRAYDLCLSCSVH